MEEIYHKPYVIKNQSVQFEIVDTTSEYLSGTQEIYVKSASCFVLCVATTDKQSLVSLDSLLACCPNAKTVPKMIVATKCDLQSERQVSQHDLQQAQAKYDCLLIETSAKNGTNVVAAFEQIGAASLLQQQAPADKKCVIS